MTARPTLVPSPPWEGRRVVLAVTGGIACYKSVTLARDLTRLGVEVDVLLSEGASAFLRPLVFEGVTGRPVLDSLWSAEGAARHLRVAQEADVVLVAPATADLMARAAQGRADDLVTAVLLATRAPVLLAPAMNSRMWSHPQTTRNAAHLTEVLGYTLLGPADGALAAGEAEGPGRMVEPESLVQQIGRALGRTPPWIGLRVLVTAGPTREPVDAVRYLGNRSSGRMGFALARECWLRGADVTVVAGPVSLPVPEGVEVIRVETAREMRDAVVPRAGSAQLQIFAAAVSDFRPASPLEGKRKRGSGQDPEADAGTPPRWNVDLVENPDIAMETRGHGPAGTLRVGFALETDDLMTHARQKLHAKAFDWIVANPAGEPGAGFDASTNRGWILDRMAPNTPEPIPLASKEDFARSILDRVEERLTAERDCS
ncbi:MAG: bifunctional phosphopantothenoylcysteine decarboxylase/phosphopantothenate--cysteine ligase CoaBC [Gemmatimonadales bacterium]|nr:MAG: bifunctional phosphopantothenoylcysteine decarboxylase/phosphopantothenate--cysteine ligase CoaBC [Gemmatimonadales bacterium]